MASGEFDDHEGGRPCVDGVVRVHAGGVRQAHAEPGVRDAGGVERIVFAVGVVGDQDLHRTEPPFAGVEKDRDLGRIGEVRLQAGRPAARGRDLGDDLFGRLLLPGLIERRSAGAGSQRLVPLGLAERRWSAVGRDENAGPLGGQGPGRGRADAVVRPRDEGDAASQTGFGHASSS